MQIARRNDPEVQEALVAFVQAKHDADLANRKLSDAEAKLLAVMQSKQIKTSTWQDGSVKFSATYTQRVTNQINEDGLKKALGARVFNKFTLRKLDRKALEKAMSEGDVDPMVVAKFVEQEPGKPYLTYRMKDEDEAPGV